ncbi:uncharacterized protein LOC109596725 [Aethina tumida]|uniref:uncharacterized protein LOC109596725 n=1 Tax=Aethina tumida TaxID=116153 RepID=UPI00096AEF1A|nr:uncharacterized protein LOC109596725 [Aethina tumida]
MTMVEIKRLRFQNFPKYNVEGDFDDELEAELEEALEVLHPDVEFDDTENEQYEQVNEQLLIVQAHNDLQWALSQISDSLKQFVMQHPLDTQNMDDQDMRLVAWLLSQGDYGRLEDLLRTVRQNVVVNVNLSYYFKVMLIMLTFNTLMIFKLFIWDQIVSWYG